MSYDSEVLADTPLVYFKLDETSGSVAADSSGNASDATFSVAPTWGETGPGATGGVVKGILAAATGVAPFATTGFTGLMPTLTVEAWVKTTVTASTHAIIAVDDNSTNHKFYFQTVSGFLGFSVWIGGVQKNLNDSSALYNSGIWVHVAGVYDGSNLMTYTNGVRTGITAATGSIQVPGSTLPSICALRSGAGVNQWSGRISAIAAYAGALSAARILAHYNAGMAGAANISLPVKNINIQARAGTATVVTPPTTATGSLTLGGSVVPPNVSAGSLTLSASATAAATVTASGALILAGSATAGATAVATGSLALDGSATAGDPAEVLGELAALELSAPAGVVTGFTGTPATVTGVLVAVTLTAPAGTVTAGVFARVAAGTTVADVALILELNPPLRVRGETRVTARVGGHLIAVLQPSAGTSAVTCRASISYLGKATVNGATLVRVTDVPDMGDNMALDIVVELWGSYTLGGVAGVIGRQPIWRTQPGLVINLDPPAISEGAPSMPAHWAKLSASATLRQGPGHIRAIKDPAGVWDPRTGGWTSPPPGGPWTAYWTVRDLPNPPDGGFYWLGVPSAFDGSNGSAAVTHQWNPHPSSARGTPAWHSIFPFKPSVTAMNHYLQGGDVVHHPKGVNFNAHFIEHMWADFGADARQPFTWLITACVTNFPSDSYTHYLLDAGRDPRQVGFPTLSADATSEPRTINDGLTYRSLLRINENQLMGATRPSLSQSVRSRYDDALRPRMYISIFNGAQSMVGAYSPGKRYLTRGTLDNTSNQHHRYYVLGRGQGHISRSYSSHLLVFDIRYWHRALSTAELKKHYEELSSTYQFDRYRGVN